jgi:hypothetical protein
MRVGNEHCSCMDTGSSDGMPRYYLQGSWINGFDSAGSQPIYWYILARNRNIMARSPQTKLYISSTFVVHILQIPTQDARRDNAER